MFDVLGGETSTCQPEQAVDSACGPGIGLCEAGALCLPTGAGSESYQCYASDQGLGEACGEGIGDCDNFLVCRNWTDPSAPTGTCVSLVLAGAPCNEGGNAACYSGTTCIPESAQSEDWSCVKNGYIGDPCGYGDTGWCFPPLGCSLTSETAGTCEVDPCAALYEDDVCDTDGCLYADPACN